MKNLRKSLASLVADLALILGAALVSVGAGMIYIPVGVITAGCLIVAGVALAARGGGDGT